jgi:hypothetical protein
VRFETAYEAGLEAAGHDDVGDVWMGPSDEPVVLGARRAGTYVAPALLRPIVSRSPSGSTRFNPIQPDNRRKRLQRL